MQPTGDAKSRSRAAYRTTLTVDLLRITRITGAMGQLAPNLGVAVMGQFPAPYDGSTVAERGGR